MRSPPARKGKRRLLQPLQPPSLRSPAAFPRLRSWRPPRPPHPSGHSSHGNSNRPGVRHVKMCSKCRDPNFRCSCAPTNFFSLSLFGAARLEPRELRGSLYYSGKLRKVFELSFVFERHVRLGERSGKPSGLELLLGWRWKGDPGGAALGGERLVMITRSLKTTN